MRNLLRVLAQEPAALGSLVASVLPALILLGLLRLDDKEIAALVVAVNAVGGFGLRLATVPATPRSSGDPSPPSEEQHVGRHDPHPHAARHQPAHDRP